VDDLVDNVRPVNGTFIGFKGGYTMDRGFFMAALMVAKNAAVVVGGGKSANSHANVGLNILLK